MRVQFEESGVGENQGNAAVEWTISGDRVDDKDVRARSPRISVKFEVRYLVRVFAVEYSAQFVKKSTTREKICGPRGGEKIQTKI